MKVPLVFSAACALFIWIGCAASPRLSNHEMRSLKKQLQASLPVTQLGFSVKQIRISEDKKSALVVFTSAQFGDWDFVLKDDGFGRFLGTNIQPFYTPGTASTPPVTVMVDLKE